MEPIKFSIEAQYSLKEGTDHYIVGLTRGRNGNINVRPSNTVENGETTLNPDKWRKLVEFTDSCIDDFKKRTETVPVINPETPPTDEQI